MEHPNTIEAEQLVREFKKGPRAVDGIDLHVNAGEIYGFLGPNGRTRFSLHRNGLNRPFPRT